MRLRFHPAARKELHKAVDWYLQEAGVQIAAGFLDELERLQSLVSGHPQIGSPGVTGVRRLVFKQFPYTLVYRVRGDTAEVLAVAHHSRRPEYWSHRL